MIKWSRSWPDQWEGLPLDVLPVSNEEYEPPAPTKAQLHTMYLQDREVERYRRKFNMNRAEFVRTSAAMAIGFWALQAAMPGKYGTFTAEAHNTETTDACDLENATKGGLETLQNLPGEFVFDIQSHHVDPVAPWRVANPAIVAFFAAIWPQASPVLGDQPHVRQDGSIRGGGAGELDPIDNLSRFHYMKELYLDSATTMTVLSCVPSSPDTNNPLPLAESALTVHTANGMAKSQRAILHAFVMPNRGGAGMTQDQLMDPAAGAGVPGPDPIFFEDEMNLMEERAKHYGDILGGWKTYCAWGDVPYASGWWLDSDYGMRFLDNVWRISQKYGVPPVVATHKGFSLPGFDQRGASPRDVGPAAKAHPNVRFMIYHSGYDVFNYNGVPVGGVAQQPYAGDENVNSSDRTVDSFIKSLRENKWDASQFPDKNVPNVWAELGSVWRDCVTQGADSCTHLLGKLITHVGPRRIAWGTDSLWYGSPQSEIVAMRRLQMTEAGKQLYNLPHGLDGDRFDPQRNAVAEGRPQDSIRNGILGRNAAEAYNIDADAQRNAIHCDQVNEIHENYIDGLGDPFRERAPLASNSVLGPRTRREALKAHWSGEWTP